MGNSRTSGGRARTQSSASDVRAVHELFVAGRVDASFLDTAPLRRVVAESWQRSLATGVDPDLGEVRGGRAALTLDQLRATHPLASALPVIRRLLVEDASDAGVVVAVTAADGTLLWVEGDPAACKRAQAMSVLTGKRGPVRPDSQHRARSRDAQAHPRLGARGSSPTDSTRCASTP